MRLLIFGLIIIFSGLVGFEIKKRYIEQKRFLNYIRNFLEYFQLNISIYKNNINEIINNHLIQQNNKNAKYSKIFLKKHNLYSFNMENINQYIYNTDLKTSFKLFIDNIGKLDEFGEKEKIINIKNLIDAEINKTTEEIKNKGDLYFKLCLAIGVVLVLIIW